LGQLAVQLLCFRRPTGLLKAARLTKQSRLSNRRREIGVGDAHIFLDALFVPLFDKFRPPGGPERLALCMDGQVWPSETEWIAD